MLLKLVNREAAEVIEAGWHTGVITKVEFTDNSKKTGKILVFHLENTKGKQHRAIISDPAKDNRNMLEAYKVYESAFGIPPITDGKEIDINDVTGRDVDFKVIHALNPQDGKIGPSVLSVQFLPAGTAPKKEDSPFN